MTFLCQLAKTYNATKDYPVNNWFSSPKFDGVRCLFIPGEGLFSRTLKTKYVGLEHIENVCKQMGDNIIDGELYIPGERFDTISGIVRKTKKYDTAQKSRVQFHVLLFSVKAGGRTQKKWFMLLQNLYLQTNPSLFQLITLW